MSAMMGAGGACPKHGVYDGLRCPECATAGPLDRIPGKPPYRIAGIPPGIISSDDYDVTDEALSFLARHEALVNVAKAAEEAARLSRPTEAQVHAFREALAALDKEPA